MPVAYPGFVGPSAQVRSLNHNAERTINWYVEHAPGTPKFPARLQHTPGIKPFAVLGDGPIRALFAQDGRAWAVTGSSLYEFFASGTGILRGTTAADGKPASISGNGTYGVSGNQLFITHGGVGFILDTISNVVVPVTTNAEPVVMGAFSDGYFFALKDHSNLFTISNLLNGLIWDPLDFFAVSTTADQVKALVESHREIWLFGSQTSSVWQNVGGAEIFAPIGGVKIAQGIVAPFSAVSLDNTLYWMGGNEHGNRVIYRAKGYTPERISDHGVEYALNNFPRVDDTVAWAYQDEGHSFYVLYLPSPPHPNRVVDHTTWVYDVATGQWHERDIWNSRDLVSEPHRGRCHCYAFGKHLIGDRSGPGIYEMSLDLHQDTVVVVA